MNFTQIINLSYCMFVLDHFVVDIYLIKCITWITRKVCEILSNKQRRHQHEVIDIFLMSLLLSLKKLFRCFWFWLWTSKYRPSWIKTFHRSSKALLNLQFLVLQIWFLLSFLFSLFFYWYKVFKQWHVHVMERFTETNTFFNLMWWGF